MNANTQTTPTDNNGAPITEDDILRSLAAIAKRQSTRFVTINNLRMNLGLTDEDRSWLRITLMKMDVEGRILLSCVERPQALSIPCAAWGIPNGAGVPCHELALPDASPRSDGILPSQPDSQPAPKIDFVRAFTDGLQHMHLRSRRGLAPLLSKAADSSRPFRPVPAPMPQTSTLELA